MVLVLQGGFYYTTCAQAPQEPHTPDQVVLVETVQKTAPVSRSTQCCLSHHFPSTIYSGPLTVHYQHANQQIHSNVK